MSPMSTGKFVFAICWRIAVLVALTLGFPYFLYGLAWATDCAGVGGACGALGAVASVYLKPAIAVLFALFMILPPVRRMRAVGGPWFAGLAIAPLFLADWQFMTAVGAPWSYGFIVGILPTLPAFFLLALLALFMLAAATPPRDERDRLLRRHAGLGALAIAGLVAVGAVGIALLALDLQWRFSAGDSIERTVWMIELAQSLRLWGTYGAFAVMVPVGLVAILEIVRRLRGAGGAPPAWTAPGPVVPRPPQEPPRSNFGRRAAA